MWTQIIMMQPSSGYQTAQLLNILSWFLTARIVQKWTPDTGLKTYKMSQTVRPSDGHLYELKHILGANETCATCRRQTTPLLKLYNHSLLFILPTNAEADHMQFQYKQNHRIYISGLIGMKLYNLTELGWKFTILNFCELRRLVDQFGRKRAHNALLFNKPISDYNSALDL